MIAAAATLEGASAEIGEAFLRRLADPARRPIVGDDVCVVVAHPDDETIACGAQLARLRGAGVVIVTDGAPADLVDAHANGCATASDYAHMRDGELRQALAFAGIHNVVRLGVTDQTAARQLAPLARRLADVLGAGGVRVVLTHAYEGGHPDHDAVAFAVHAAVVIRRRQGHDVAVIEMPLYYPAPSGWVVQRFLPALGRHEVVIALNPDERALKAKMVAAHASQRRVLAMFALDAERFRPASGYDFGISPRDGGLWSHGEAWGLTGREWLALARNATLELEGA